MNSGVINHDIYVLILSMVAGTPLLLAGLCCTRRRRIAWQGITLAPIPALLAAFFVPAEISVYVPWFFMSGHMGLDETGRIFLGLSAFIWLLAALSCRSLFSESPGTNRLNVFFLAAMSGNFGLILAQDMLGYYLFFALMSFAAYGLVVHNATEEARKAGRIYLIFVVLGEVALFQALVHLADGAQSLLLADLAGTALPPVVLVLLFIGFGVKVGALPFHFWMPASYQAIPAPAAAALAGAMVNAGLLGWLRFMPLGEVTSGPGALCFISAGGLAVFYGVIVGLAQKRSATILAYSSISQMGLMTVIFGFGLSSLAAGDLAAGSLILYAVHHSLAKGSLFLGYAYLKNHKGPLGTWQIAGYLLPALSLAGMPLTSGAVAKLGFKELVLLVGEPWSGLSDFFLPLSAVGTTLLVLHFIQVARHDKDVRQTGGSGAFLAWIASLVAVGFAVWLWPAVRTPAEHSLQAVKLWQSFWPVATGALLFLLWRGFCKRGRAAQLNYSSWCGFVWLKKLHQATSLWRKDMSGINSLLRNRNPIYQAVIGGEQEEGAKKRGNAVKPLAFGKIDLIFRKSEKIMGRWMVVGLAYLLLWLFFFLFLG
jgi:formate hydrogenlyase subunit 3/multisubunit Na+/H+ antiporter MnhD subunit